MSGAQGQVSGDEDVATTQSLLWPFERDVLLATGRAVHVRLAVPSDVESLRSFYGQLGEAANRLRFFGLRRFIPDKELERATEQDVLVHITLLAESGGMIVGVGEYHAPLHGEDAEVAFAVADAHHHEGIATVLLEDLALIARAAGFRRLVAETLPGNAAMLGVFQTVGLVHRSWFEDGVVHVHLDLTADDLLQDDADLRDWRAVVRSLRSVVRPAHVVVIGAGRDAMSPGRRILAHLIESYSGQVSVLHPTASSVGGIDAVAGLDELDGVPDLAIIAVPARSVADMVSRCGTARVPTAVVISAGFAELGADGARLQDDVLAAARRYGMRIVGPNCLGIVSTACGLNATFTDQEFRPGGIAIASQSGGVGIALAAEAERRHAGVSSFVSMGNKADVSGNDLLRLWAEDDSTNVVLLYLESIGDPVRFARIARTVSPRKPVVAVKSGGSVSGRRGASSHTAALASDQAMVDALFAHTGVIRARTLEELIDVGLLLDGQGAPGGRRVALVGNAGGPLILGADCADAGGLDVPVLSPRLQAHVARLAPAAASTANPVDLGAGVMPDRLAAVVQAIGRSGEVDACIVVGVDVGERRRLEEAGRLLATTDVSVPVALCLIGAGDRNTGSLPTFPTPERAAAAVALAAQRADWLASVNDDTCRDTSGLDASTFVGARRLARRHAGGRSDTTLLDGPASFELVRAAGLPVVPWEFARSGDACARAAERIGVPCVVKAEVVGRLHKSDSGAVRLGVSDTRAADETYHEFERTFGERLLGAVVQPAQQAAGLELLLGIIRDPAFGPLVIVGAGGAEAELRDDRVVLVAPVSTSAARRALDSLRLAPLLHGYGGRPELPIDLVVELIQRVGMLAATVPEIQQLDMNPVLVGVQACTIVDTHVSVAAPRWTAVPVRGLRGHPGR